MRKKNCLSAQSFLICSNHFLLLINFSPLFMNRDPFLLLIFLFPSPTAAADHHVPQLPVSPALLTAQTSAYNPPRALHSPHASCSVPGYLSRSRQDGQVHQPGGNDIAGLLLRLVCPLWHPWGRQAGLTNGHCERDDSRSIQFFSVQLDATSLAKKLYPHSSGFWSNLKARAALHQQIFTGR